MPFDDQLKLLLEDVTDVNWYQVHEQEKQDWICSEAMSYKDAIALQNGFHAQVQAQLWPANKQLGLFKVGIYSPQLTRIMNSDQEYFLNALFTQNNIKKKIQAAKNLEDLINIINNHPAKILSDNAEEIPKKKVIAAIKNQLNPNPDFQSIKLAKSYELEEKVKELMLLEQKVKMVQQNILPLAQKNARQNASPSPQKGILKASKEEWEKAEAYFAQDFSKNPHLDPIKMKKDKSDPNSHSFIKVGNEIYQMATLQCLDERKHARLWEGTSGIVKVVQNRSGENFAVKIEGRGARGDNEPELKIGKILNFVIGESERYYNKKFKGKLANKKLYTIMQLLKGNDLLNELYQDTNAEQRSDKFNDTQKLIIALKACRSIDELHKHNILHRDIKPANFIVDVEGNLITVSAIDFGISSILSSGQSVIISTVPVGTEFYMAPEIDGALRVGVCKYSKASDVYSLGIMLRDDLQMPLHLYEKMLDIDPNKRASLSDIMNMLVVELKKQDKLDNDAISVIADFSTTPTPLLWQELINPLLSKDAHQLTSEYAKIHEGKKGKIGGWARARTKETGGDYSNIRNNRAEQITELSAAFAMIRDNKALSVYEKVEMTYGYIRYLRNKIEKEGNHFRSALRQLCDHYLKQIEKTVGAEETRRFKSHVVLTQAKQLHNEIHRAKLKNTDNRFKR